MAGGSKLSKSKGAMRRFRPSQVRMPMQETFWAVRFGMLVDRFGIPWMVNCEKVAHDVKETEEAHAIAS